MKFSIALLLTLMTSVHAATIAIIDSGIDYQHQELEGKMWSSSGNDPEFPEVINGWNFSENSNQILNYSKLASYPSEIHRVVDINNRLSQQIEIDDNDKEFYAKTSVDLNYILTPLTYVDFAHGTHVAGIAAMNSDHKLMGLVFGREKSASDPETPSFRSVEISSGSGKNSFFEGIMLYASKKELEEFDQVVKFLGRHHADIANASYGSSFKEAEEIHKTLFTESQKREPTDKESQEGTNKLISVIIKYYEKALKSVADTLFVFSAGNDGINNDQFFYAPSNVSSANAIAVAATNGDSSLYVFSNYGLKTVDIAAPGVSINSTAPGSGYMRLTGTSQAAPFVSRIAGMIKDINPKLTPAQVKIILMETVDKKTFLKNLVKSGGIVSEKRSLRAAELSRTMNLKKSIKTANKEIKQK